nr:hypothetical protein [Tanacetum cinerariifolium]
MATLAFYDYHNVVAILEKTEHNTDFHQIVDFLKASHIRYALTISPTVYVSHIRQFWSTARIETMNQETKILATVDGKPQTLSKSSLERHLKLNNEEGISSLPDAELFENLSLMGYNILPNQRFTFQKGQFSHQWKFFIHTIMQCLSPKSTGFNEFSSNIATYVVCLATNRVYNFSKMIVDGMGEGSAKPTKPHHTPSPQEQQVKHHSPQHDSPPPSPQTIISEPLPPAPTETPTFKRYTRRAIQIAQSKSLSPAANEPASLSRDDRQGEAFPTISSLDAGHDMENVANTSALPHDSSPRVTSLDADEDQNLEISRLKARVKSLEDNKRRNVEPTQEDAPIIGGIKEIGEFNERRNVEPTQEDAPIIGGIKEIGEELGPDKSTELGSNDTKEMVNVLSSMEAANILTSGGVAASVSLSPTDVPPAAGVPTVSGSFPTASAIFTNANKGKEKVVEFEVPKKRKLQEQIDAQVAREMKEEFTRENQGVSKQLAKDSEIARLHAEEELKMMIEGLDRNNEVIAKNLREYEQAATDLFVGKKLELIRMTLEQIKEKIIPVWKQLKNFVPMYSKEESERVKRQGIKIDQGILKRMKTSKSVFEDVSEEELKGMMHLVPLEEVYVEALQVKHSIIDWEIHSKGKREYWKIIRLGGHTAVYQFFFDMLKQFNRKDLYQLWTLVKETCSIKQATKDNKKELWVELKRLFEPDFEDQLWTHNQAFMHDPLD